MTDLYRTRVGWSGFPGGPGVSTFYGLVSGAMLPHLHTLFGDMAAYFPTDVTFSFENGGDVISDTTGELVGAWVDDVVGDVVGTSAVAYPAPCGLAVTWNTDTVLDGSRLRGRTYLVPLHGAAYQVDGSLLGSTITDFGTHLATFVGATAGDLVIWHRPRVARAADGSRPAVTARAGGHGLVTSASIRDKVAVLRSRRD